MYLMQIVTMAKGLSEAAMSRRLHLLVAIQVSTVNTHIVYFLLYKLCQKKIFLNGWLSFFIASLFYHKHTHLKQSMQLIIIHFTNK